MFKYLVTYEGYSDALNQSFMKTSAYKSYFNLCILNREIHINASKFSNNML